MKNTIFRVAAILSAVMFLFIACNGDDYRDPAVSSVSVVPQVFRAAVGAAITLEDRFEVTVATVGGASALYSFVIYEDEDDIARYEDGVLKFSDVGQVIVRVVSNFDITQFATITINVTDGFLISMSGNLTVIGSYEGEEFYVADGEHVFVGTEIVVSWEHTNDELGLLHVNGESYLALDIDIDFIESASFMVNDDLNLELIMYDRKMIEEGLQIMNDLSDLGILVGMGTGATPEAVRANFLANLNLFGLRQDKMYFRIGALIFGFSATNPTMFRVFRSEMDATVWQVFPDNRDPDTSGDQHSHRLLYQHYIISGGNDQNWFMQTLIRYGPPSRIGTFNEAGELVLKADFQQQFNGILEQLANFRVNHILVPEQWFNNPGFELSPAFRRAPLNVNLPNRDNEFMVIRHIPTDPGGPAPQQGFRGITAAGFTFRIFGCENWARSTTTYIRSNTLGGFAASHHWQNIALGSSTGGNNVTPAITINNNTIPLVNSIIAFLEGNPIGVIPEITQTQLELVSDLRDEMLADVWTNLFGTTIRATFAVFNANEPATHQAWTFVFSNEAEAIRFYERPTTTGGAPLAANVIVQRAGNVVTHGTQLGTNRVIELLAALTSR